VLSLTHGVPPRTAIVALAAANDIVHGIEFSHVNPVSMVAAAPVA